jgi:lipoyl(octanoyl) transferase 2
MMRLAHLSVPGPISYSHASRIQTHLVNNLLAHKAHTPDSPSIPPDPTILTTQFTPVYTSGRREIGTVTQEQQQFLTRDEGSNKGKAEFFEALRGGQTTFHGPGQFIAYPIIDLKRHNITPRCYIRLLEDTLIAACAKYGVKAYTTENPGTWVAENRKIASVGVRLRRNVSSHGVGLNVGTDLWWFGRITACGLPGVETTSLSKEGVVPVPTVEEVGETFVCEFAKALKGVDEVYKVQEEDLGENC